MAATLKFFGFWGMGEQYAELGTENEFYIVNYDDDLLIIDCLRFYNISSIWEEIVWYYLEACYLATDLASCLGIPGGELLSRHFLIEGRCDCDY